MWEIAQNGHTVRSFEKCPEAGDTAETSEQSPPHQSASQCKGSRLFGQGEAGFAQKKAPAVPLMRKCGKKRKDISLHLVVDVSLPFMCRISVPHPKSNP